jgi:hypothetical protein
MGIRPTGYSAQGVEVWHDERGHGGTVPWAEVDYLKRPDGTGHQSYVVLPCPVAGCGSVSTHPVSGGADRDGVRELFAQHYRRRGGGTIEEARELVRQRAKELDGRE